MENKNTEETKIKNNEAMENGDPTPVDPMTFMTPEQAAEEDKKVKAFIKAFRFGTPEFFAKIKEVYEAEGIKGLKRLEMSLDTYMGIRGAVIAEVIESRPENPAEAPSSECESAGTEAGEEETALAE